MKRLIPLLPIVLAGCAATADGEWPSLARRPGEIEAGTRAAPEPIPAAAPAAAAPVGEAGAVTVSTARITDISREFDEALARWQRQRVATDAALAAAGRAAPSTPAWSKAQLELTRLERLGATIGELGERANAIAGDIAQAAAGGSDVSAALASAGALIGRIEAARADHLAAFETAQRALNR